MPIDPMSFKLTEAGNQYRRNRRFLKKTGHKFGLYDDLNPFDTSPPVTEDHSGAPVTKSTEMSCQNVYQNSSPKSISSSRNSIPPSPKSNPSSQPYITRFGRAVKLNVMESM